jgi:flagellin FlaB
VIKTFCYTGILDQSVSTVKEGKIMIASKRNDEGFTGLEAAIVLIAFVVVAAVFSYVVLGAGFFTTQKAQETVYKGVEQSTANIQMIGNVYGFSSNSTGATPTLTNITFVIGLAPGAPALDMTRMKIVFSTPSTTPVILTQNTTSSTSYFTTKIGTTSVTSINANDQVEVFFGVADVPANTKMTIELRPSVGAALPFSKTAPATITATNVLY